MASLKERGTAAPAEIKASVTAPSPAEISAEELHKRLESADRASVVVVDVRTADDYAAFHIPGSLNKPFQEINFAQLATEMAPHASHAAHVLVFVSAQSPDVDDLAAREYINEYEKTHAAPPAKDSVCVLLGGLYTWSQLYSA
ncbi:Rhodanese-like domain containing protein [Novymonas esmeraldas]|uniref:Rhodanese-like domain containing protein n=1 Tax=Novymonas esmeraldas TaxID=1808958 RepID=A0AAW0EKR7_9TRYP